MVKKKEIEKVIEHLIFTVEDNSHRMLWLAEENYETLRRVYMWRNIERKDIEKMIERLNEIKKRADEIIQRLKDTVDFYFEAFL